MKRYLVTLTGRKNLGYIKMREQELVCSYVFANNKKDAISLFWGELETNEQFKFYSRRDFKIEIERWDEGELDINGNPISDWELAIPLEDLTRVRWNYKTNRFDIPTEENIKAEEKKSAEAHELAQTISQMDAGEVCVIVEKALDEIKTEKAQNEAQKSSEDEAKEINPESDYHVVRVNKSTSEQIDCGTWSGHGMDFKAGFNGFFKEDDTFIWYATEIEPETAPEIEAKEINQPEPEMATESKPEHHRIILASFDVSREQIDAWNRLAEAVKGTSSYYVFSLWHEYKDVNGRWQELSHGTIRSNRIELEGERFYVRKIKDNFWLYWEYRGEAERWLLSDLAKAYFDVREVD